MFNPAGNLQQVDYVLIGVRNGQRVGSQGGIVLATEKYNPEASVFLAPSSSDKVMRLTKHIGLVYGGCDADARHVAQKAREVAYDHKKDYGMDISVKNLAQQLDGIRMREHPSFTKSIPRWGSCLECKAVGRNSDQARASQELNYDENISLGAAARVALLSLREAVILSEEHVEMVVCRVRNPHQGESGGAHPWGLTIRKY